MANEKVKSTQVSVELLQEHATSISKIDSAIAAASGNDAQVRKSVIEELTNTNADSVNKLATQIITQLQKVDPAVLVGLQAKVEEAFSGQLKELTETII